MATFFPVHILQADKRLSQSLIWDIQRRYFLNAGISAWRNDVVPHGISCNPRMAHSYSQLIFGYLRDCFTAHSSGELDLNFSQPLYIIELGAGSGRLTHNLLYQFYEQYRRSALPQLPVKFILTDYVPDILAFWQQHPKLQPWVEQGILDFASFDVNDMQPLHLLNANKTLTADAISNPPILLANYFFDSIPQDSFVIEDGQLQHNLLTLYSSQPEPNLEDPALWERLELAWEAIPLQEAPYAQESYCTILDEYEAVLPDTVVAFPNVGLDCLRFWQQFAGGNGLLLAGDRGYSLPEELVGRDNPQLNLHGSFSTMVNFDAFGRFITNQNGRALQTTHYQNELQIGAYLYGTPPAAGTETARAFSNAIGKHDPNDFFTLRQLAETQADQLSLEQMLSLLRLSQHDADLLRSLYPRLLVMMESAETIWHDEITSTLNSIQKSYLPLSPNDELEDILAQLIALLRAI